MNIDITKIKSLSTETLMQLSACIDKMEIGEKLKDLNVETGDEAKDREELGKQLIILIITNLHKAKEEIYELIANYKKMSVEEAKKTEIIPIIKELLGVDGAIDFLS